MSVQTVDMASVDFAVAAWREEGRWVASAMPARIATEIKPLIAALRQLPAEGGVLGFVGVGDEFFLLLRVDAAGVRTFISDSVAVLDWSLAEEAAELAGIIWEEDDLEEFVPIGDMELVADLGLGSEELAFLVDESDLYPDDQVKAIAKAMGFGDQVAAALKAR